MDVAAQSVELGDGDWRVLLALCASIAALSCGLPSSASGPRAFSCAPLRPAAAWLRLGGMSGRSACEAHCVPSTPSRPPAHLLRLRAVRY